MNGQTAHRWTDILSALNEQKTVWWLDNDRFHGRRYWIGDKRDDVVCIKIDPAAFRNKHANFVVSKHIAKFNYTFNFEWFWDLWSAIKSRNGFEKENTDDCATYSIRRLRDRALWIEGTWTNDLGEAIGDYPPDVVPAHDWDEEPFDLQDEIYSNLQSVKEVRTLNRIAALHMLVVTVENGDGYAITIEKLRKPEDVLRAAGIGREEKRNDV